MTKTYTQLMKQIAALSRDAERLKKNEVKDVVTRIKEAIDTYRITAADLGLRPKAAGARRGPKPGSKRRTAAGGKKASKAEGGRSPKAVVRFRDGDGNTWVGRGPRPGWLRDALASGKSLGDFAV